MGWLNVACCTNAIAAEEISSRRRGHRTRRRAPTRERVVISPTRSVRPPALRLRADADFYTVHDLLHGSYTGIVDDFVVRRGDGVPAYNLAVVVDDAAQGVDQVARRNDGVTASLINLYPEMIPDGTVIWTDPGGQTHTTRPAEVTGCFPHCADPPHR